ncbi:Clp protease N-terminal domain-containing protein [Streptomyces sp. M19]
MGGSGLPGFEVRQSPELAAAVTGARRRALRDGDSQVDTAHLLHTLLECDPRVRAACGGPDRLPRLLGYLAQRAIGYGLRWSGRIEDSGAVRTLRGGRDGEPEAATALRWSPAASAAMDGALARAHERGAARAEGLDLLAALAGDPEARAVEVLRRAGIDAEVLVAGLDGEQRQ